MQQVVGRVAAAAGNGREQGYQALYHSWLCRWTVVHPGALWCFMKQVTGESWWCLRRARLHRQPITVSNGSRSGEILKLYKPIQLLLKKKYINAATRCIYKLFKSWPVGDAHRRRSTTRPNHVLWHLPLCQSTFCIIITMASGFRPLEIHTPVLLWCGYEVKKKMSQKLKPNFLSPIWS